VRVVDVVDVVDIVDIVDVVVAFVGVDVDGVVDIVVDVVVVVVVVVVVDAVVVVVDVVSGGFVPPGPPMQVHIMAAALPEKQKTQHFRSFFCMISSKNVEL
jgi:hypothetical protein